ncbi:uncharacterized protein FYW47_014591 [Aplochiton taeniatus]
MSKTQLLRMLINERLSAAAIEIFGIVEKTIAEYEVDVRCSQRENARQLELLNVLLKPEIKLHRADPQKFTLSTEEVPPEQQHCEQEMSPSLDQEDPEPPQIKEEVPPEKQHCEQERSPSLDQEDPEPPQIEEEVPPEQQHCEQERSPSLDQEDPEPPQIKEEQEELWTNQEGEQLQDLKEEETDTEDSMSNVTCVESTFNQGQTQFSHLDKYVDATSTDQMKTEPDGEDCGVSEPDSSITETLAACHSIFNNSTFAAVLNFDHCPFCSVMSKTQLLRVLINERLSAAAIEIFGVVERTIAEYEEEVRCSQRENARQRELLTVLLKPEIKLHTADPQKFTLSTEEVSPEQQHCEQERSPSLDQEDPEPPQIKEEVPPEQQHCEQERSPSLDQEDPEPPQIKEEQEELWSSQEGEQLQDLKEEETDTKDSMLTVACVENIFAQGQTQFCQLDKSPAVPSTDQMKTKPDGEDCGVSEPDSSITESKDSEWTLSGDNPYSCNVYSRGCSSKSKLKVHVMSHTGEKRFKCSVCLKEFSRNSHLKRHMMTHTGEKPHKCSFCGKRFHRKENLMAHVTFHTGEKPFRCSICPKEFSRKSHLEAHTMTHTGEKPFNCSICSKGFCRKTHLEYHMWTHTRENTIPLQCL